MSETEDDLRERIAKFKPEVQAKILEEFRKRTKNQPKVWFCKVGRTCDGKPHPGADYKHARSDQWPPLGHDWDVWLILSGRGGGKTESASRWVTTISKRVDRIAIVGMTVPDLRDTMILGPSGIIHAFEEMGHSDARDWYEPSKRLITTPWGCEIHGFTGEEPDSLRGGNFSAAWVDEGAHIAKIEGVWSNLNLTVRREGLPGGAKIMVTTTPIPIPWLVGNKEDGSRHVVGVMNEDRTRVVVTSSYANRDNLDQKYIRYIDSIAGTRVGRQEVYGEILWEVEGSLWKNDMIHSDSEIEWTEMDRIGVGVDPAGSTGKRSDDTGIVVFGVKDEIGYVIEDATGQYSPNEWAKKASELFHKYSANYIVAEKNYGGDMVLSTLRNHDKTIPVKVVQAQRSKQLRAEPIVTLYELKKVYHLPNLAKLEDELTTWIPGKGPSPNRVDALVHVATEMMKGANPVVIASGRRRRIDLSGRAKATVTSRNRRVA